MPIVLILIFIVFFKLFIRLFDVAVKLAIALFKLVFRILKFMFKTGRKSLAWLARVIDRHFKKNPNFVSPMTIFMSDERLFAEFMKQNLEEAKTDFADTRPGGKTIDSFSYTMPGRFVYEVNLKDVG